VYSTLVRIPIVFLCLTLNGSSSRALQTLTPTRLANEGCRPCANTPKASSDEGVNCEIALASDGVTLPPLKK
jgi:hypothetical protein